MCTPSMTGTAQQPPVWLIKSEYHPVMMHTTQITDKNAQSSAPVVMEGLVG